MKKLNTTLFDLDVIFYALKYISDTPSVFGAFKNILGINKRDNKRDIVTSVQIIFIEFYDI